MDTVDTNTLFQYKHISYLVQGGIGREERSRRLWDPFISRDVSKNGRHLQVLCGVQEVAQQPARSKSSEEVQEVRPSQDCLDRVQWKQAHSLASLKYIHSPSAFRENVANVDEQSFRHSAESLWKSHFEKVMQPLFTALAVLSCGIKNECQKFQECLRD